MASVGYVGVQIPSWDSRCIDLQRAADSKTYCDEIRGVVTACGLQITDLSTHLQGQLIAVHPAYDLVFDAFAPEHVRGSPGKRTARAVAQLQLAARASRNLGLNTHANFLGGAANHIIQVTGRAFDDFAAGAADRALNRKILGITD
jgi:hypothetical protein